jgi:superfamily I DNA/RNA helicase
MLITANAGCGKTFTLANRVIGWMLLGRRERGTIGVEGLLAATFTRKAAGEILERILEHLAQAVLIDGSLDKYKESIGIDPPACRDDCIAVLDDLSRSLHQMQVGTLDSLFNRLATACAGEAGLPAGWRIGSPEALHDIHMKAIDDLLDDSDDARIETIVIAAESLLLKGRGQAGVHRAVWGSGVLDLWKRSLCTSAGDAWRWLLRQPIEDVFPGACWLSDNELAKAAEVLRCAAVPTNKDGSESKAWVSARDGVANKTIQGDFNGVLSSGLVEAAHTGGTYYKIPIPEGLAQALSPMTCHALALQADALRSRMEGWLTLVGDVERFLSIRQRREGLYEFGDISWHLSRASLLVNRSDQWLQFRLDTTMRDIALDEFQDTSLEQYNVLQPVLQEIFDGAGAHDEGRKLLVVADPKQSIYAWRGGTPALINAVKVMGGPALQTLPLAKSWRSAPPIMAFANMVFENLDTNAALLGAEEVPVEEVVLDRVNLGHAAQASGPVGRVLEQWQWTEHESEHTKMQGGVHVHVPPFDAKAAKDLAFDLTVELVQARLGFAESIGILLPTNDQVAELSARLRAKGLEVSEEGAGTIGKLPAIKAVLALLHLAEHPGDRDSAFLVSHGPLGDWIGLAPLESIPSETEQQAAMSAAARRVRVRLLRMGLEGMLGDMANAIESACDVRNARAMSTVVRLAGAWQSGSVQRLRDFVHHVQKARISTAAGAKVRIMTVHGAKGLEFDEVILPLIDEKLMRERGECLALTDGPLGTLLGVTPRVHADRRWTAPALEVFRQQALAADLSDRLSGLYVAMTRAKRRLHLIAQNHAKEVGKVCTSANLIRAAIPELDTCIRAVPTGASDLAWSYGDDLWASEPLPASPPAPKPARPTIVASGRPPIVDDQSLHLSIEVSSGRPRRDGIALHEALCAVQWLDDGPPDEAQLAAAFDRAALQTGRPVGPDLAASLKARLDEALNGPMGNALRRSAYDHWTVDELLVYNELPLWGDDCGRIVEHRLDRLVLGLRDGRVVHGAVLDYKSGIRDQAEAMETYGTQLERYAALVADTWGLSKDAIETHLLLIDAGT